MAIFASMNRCFNAGQNEKVHGLSTNSAGRLRRALVVLTRDAAFLCTCGPLRLVLKVAVSVALSMENYAQTCTDPFRKKYTK